MLQALNGYKTYILAAVTVAYALASYWAGSMDQQTLVLTILGALGASSVRHAIAKGPS